VSSTVLLILEFPTDSRAVVKSFREDECLDMDSEPEDSDRESHLQRAGDPVPEYQVDEKKESEQEPLPVIAIGSLARYAQHSAVAGLKFLTLSIAGDRYSSTCARA